MSENLTMLGASLLVVSGLVLLAAYIIYKRTPAAEQIRHMVYRGLCCPAFGNPLRLRDGEFLPRVSCVPAGSGRYVLTVTGASVAMEDLVKSAPRISSLINGKYQHYAVVYTEGAPDYYQINKAAMQHIVRKCPPPTADRQAVYAAWREARDAAEKRMMAPPKKISFNRKRFAPYLDDLGSDREIEALFLEFLRERGERTEKS